MLKAMSFRSKLRYLVVYVLLIAFVVYTLIPFLTIVLTSLRSKRDVLRGPFSLPAEWSAIRNYSRAWGAGRFDQYLLNSMYLLMVNVVGSLVVCTLAGYSFAKFRFPGCNIMYYGFLLSMIVPFQTIMLPVYFVLKALRLINTLTGVAVLGIATGLGFGTMMMRSFFVSFPTTLVESARIDGCNEAGILVHIVLPNTFPAWSSLVVFSAMASWNNLLAPMLYIFKEAKYPIPYALYAFRGNHSTEYELLAAAMLISITPLLVIYLVFQSRFQSNLLAGAIKG